MDWISENAGTILVSLALLAVVTAIVRQLIRDKKKGKSACGNSCASCPMHGPCHQK